MTWVAIAVLAALGVGFGAGWGLKPDTTVKVLEAQNEAIQSIQEGQVKLVEQTAKPLIIDADIRDALAKTPPPCREPGGNPLSLACMASQCWQYGQSSAQRPEKCGDLIEEFLRQQRSGCMSPPVQPK